MFIVLVLVLLLAVYVYLYGLCCHQAYCFVSAWQLLGLLTLSESQTLADIALWRFFYCFLTLACTLSSITQCCWCGTAWWPICWYPFPTIPSASFRHFLPSPPLLVFGLYRRILFADWCQVGKKFDIAWKSSKHYVSKVASDAALG